MGSVQRDQGFEHARLADFGISPDFRTSGKASAPPDEQTLPMRHPLNQRAAFAFLAVWTAAVVSAPDGLAAKTGKVTPEELDFFEKRIRPVLAEHCYECHSEESGKSKGELFLDTRDGIRAGGEHGAAVVPGSVDTSILIQAIRQQGQLRMPPEKKGGKLPDAVIADFEKWVASGAPDPRDAAKIAITGPAKPEKVVDWEKERQFWAFQKPKEIAPPEVRDKKWPRSPIDRFVLAKQEEKGLKPAGDADRQTLGRRIYYDLTGLPPSPEELDAFVKDRSPGAYEKLVDKLLASSRFGEQWGRHWLDVARYGESTGMDRNLNYPYAWRYRDYVIESFNEDKPYDRFIVEQLAGDLLPAKDQRERDTLLIATGFLAIGPKGLNETRPKYLKWQFVDDQIDATARGFLGLTIGCARCHDHKFDPIPTRDYHALAGIFASTDVLYGTVGGRGNRRPTPLLGLAGNADRPVLDGGGPVPNMFVNTNRDFGGAARTNGLAGGAARGKGTNTTNAARAKSKGEEKKGEKSSGPVERVPAHGPYAMGVKELKPVDSPIYFRGDLSKPKEAVPRGFPRIIALVLMPKIPEDKSGRLELAQWITDPENPLTARVVVNRAWQHLFGAGLVTTPDNLGHLGARPSHPELLDYLAVKFASGQKWSVKQLVRSLVLTRVYQLSSQGDAKAVEVDPGNVLLSHASPRRLPAEAIRDTLLSTSGQLDLAPPQGAVTADFGDGYYGVNIWPTDFPGDYRKRSVYLPIVRDVLPESLSLFDFPNPSLVSARREDTTSPSQALFLMNNSFVEEESLRLAQRLLGSKGKGEKEKIREAYRLVLLREPTSKEIRRARSFITEQARSTAPVDQERPGFSGAATAAPAALEPGAQSGEPGMTLAIASAGVRADGKPLEVYTRTVKTYEPPAPGNAREAAWALFAQALFASAEFRYLQ